MKQRITSLDIKLLISELQDDLKNYRLQNIYNLLNSNKGFLLKFAIPDCKRNLVIDCGSKFYATDFQRPTTPEPSNFVVKLRKHLKSKRLTRLKQLGDDRIVILEFNDGLYYLVLEFFSAGNVILLDQDLKILSLQRLVAEKENNDRYAVGETYNQFEQQYMKDDIIPLKEHIYSKEEILSWVTREQEQQEQGVTNGGSKKSKVLSIHKLLFVNGSYLSSDLIQIKLHQQKINPSESCLSLTAEDSDKVEAVVEALNSAHTALSDIIKETPHTGFIISKKNELFDSSKPDQSVEFIFEEFHPYLPVHKSIDHSEQIEGYNKTVDKFFTSIEANKNVLKEQQLQQHAEKRLQLVKDENLSKIDKLEELQQLNVKKAELIMVHNDVVENCKEMVQSLLDQQLDWINIEKLISLQKKRGNQLAQFINIPLNLKENKISLSLPDVDFEEESESKSDSDLESDSDSDSDSDAESESESISKKRKQKSKKDAKFIKVVIDLSLSAFANSSLYFDAKRDAAQKKLKTEQNATLAIKNTERKISKDLRKAEKQTSNQLTLKQLRPKMWFEKFFWFISSDGYLCLAGRDDAQIDLVYYKYFNDNNDYLVSNDLENSLKMVIKNPYKNKEIPPTTLIQAGIYSLSTTKAWENKMVTSPWFVKGKDVSKKDFDGSILSTGMLNVTKEKNYLPPAQLNLGIGFYWLGDDATATKYVTNTKKRDEELGFKVVNDQEVVARKTDELKNLLMKMEADFAKDELKSQVDDVEEKLESSSIKEETDAMRAPSPYDQTQVKVRGKKAKLKKIKQKYADQDEEERKLRMQLLGNAKPSASASGGKAAAGVENDKDSSTQQKRPGNWKSLRKKQQIINQLKKILQELEGEGEEEEEDTEIEAQADGEGEHQVAGDANGTSPAQVKPHLLSFTESIAKLIPSPLKTDTIEDVIPVFAPWSSLQKCKYKIKIQQGNLKKGKVISDLFEYYKKDHIKKTKDGSDGEWFDEKSLITDINQQDLLLTITVNKMRLAVANDSNNNKKNGHRR